MRHILLSNKEDFDSVAGFTVEKYFAVNRQNAPWSKRLRQKSPLATSKRLTDEPHRTTRFFLRINDFCQQQNLNLIGG